MQKVSFSTGALYPLESADAFSHIKRAGFDHAELMPQAFCDVEESSIPEYLKTGIHVASIHYPLAMFSMLYSSHRSMSMEGREFSTKLVNMGHRLGTDVVVIHTTNDYQGEMKALEPLVLDNIRFLGDLCEKNNITLAMENHPTGVGNDPFTLEEYIKAWNMPVMHPMVDTTEVREGGGDPYTFIHDLPEVPCHLHLSDFGNGTKHLPIGLGEIAWKPIFTLLKDRGYQGYYTLEPSYRNYLSDIDAKLRRDREFMEQWQ